MDTLSISTRLTVADWQAYQRACALKLQQTAAGNGQAWRTVAAAVAGAVLVLIGVRSGMPLQLPSFFAGGLLIGVSIWFRTRLLSKDVVPDRDGMFLAPQTLELQPDGLHSQRHGIRSFTSWSRMQSVSVTADHIFLWVDRFNAHIVPVRDLPDGVTAEQCSAWLDERMSGSLSPAPPEAAGTADGTRPNSWPHALLRLLTLRRTSLPRSVGAAAIAAPALLALAAWTVVDWLENRPDPQLYLYGLPAIGWYVLLLLSLAAVLALRSAPRADFGSVLALVLAVTPVAIVADWLIGSISSRALSLTAATVACAYLVAYAARGMQTVTGRGQPGAILLCLAVVLLFDWSTGRLYVEPSLWATADEAETDDDDTWQQAESLLFSQAAKIDRAVAALVRPDDAAPVAFFLGFAGMGEQRVFAEEIKLAAHIVGEKYGSDARNVLLINDRRDLQSQPLASPTALRYALRGIAAKMHLDRDVLFVSLSSHGSKDATLAVSNGALMLHDLSAAELASALDASGIQWRIVVVSACYSGAFIAPLQTPRTVVITASSADRTSFGCSDDRDLTYFGEAWYRDALPKAKSLRAAYEAARDDIKHREQEEGITASRPQAFFGKEIEQHLALLRH